MFTNEELNKIAFEYSSASPFSNTEFCAFKEGMLYILNNIPKWSKDNSRKGNYINKDGYYLYLDDLDKLPKKD